MAREEWSRRARAALAARAIISAVLSPLITAYKFLSAHHVMPHAPESTGILTIFVNMCVVTTLLAFFGCLTGFAFAWFSSRERWPGAIGRAVLLSVFALAFLFYPYEPLGRLVGTLILVAVLLSLSPLAPWIQERSREATIVWGALFLLLLFLTPGWIEGLWQNFTEQSHFAIIPLSQMSLAGWFSALVGLALYVGAFITFQQWRTEGKWLRDMKDRLRHSS